MVCHGDFIYNVMNLYCEDCTRFNNSPNCFIPIFKNFESDYCRNFKLHKCFTFKIDNTQTNKKPWKNTIKNKTNNSGLLKD